MISKEDLIERIKLPEDSFIEYKVADTHPTSIAQEITAFLNHQGGLIIFGMSDDCEIIGLSNQQAKNIEQSINNICRDSIQPAITPTTKCFNIDGKFC